ncbi:MAG TPA: hypothetical protein VKX46_15015 [Ktedonobacteraceae bacterium]|jgi:hypothetical protein|nr:hypothetical protein [Ktedonobacteraceae bacterium]
MNQNSERISLDDVLNAYAISDPGPGPASLAEWIRRYPYYERELTAFVADWALVTWLPTPASVQHLDEDALVDRGMSVVQGILHHQAPPRQEKTLSLKGIVQEADRLKITPQQLAERTKMSLSLVRKLDRRLIRYSTIPFQAIEALANAIQCGSSVVAHYLQGTPIFPQSASYRAEQAPTLAEPEDFFEAVRRDMTMPQELREYWLSFASPNNQ